MMKLDAMGIKLDSEKVGNFVTRTGIFHLGPDPELPETVNKKTGGQISAGFLILAFYYLKFKKI